MKKSVKFIIISMCVLFLTACSCSNKNLGKNSNSNNESNSNLINENSNNVSNSNNENQSNSNSNNNSNDVPEVPYTLTSDESKLVNNVLAKLIPLYNNTKYTELTDKEKVRLTGDLVIKEYLSSSKNKKVNPEKVLTKEKVESTFKTYLGKNTKIDLTDYVCYVCGKPIYKYDSAKQTYVINKDHKDHAKNTNLIFRYQKGSYKKGNLIRVKYVTFFSDFIDNNFPKAFYATYKNAKNKKSPVVKDSSKYCKVQNGLKKYSCNFAKMAKENKFYTYVYNFEKKNNEFYFVGYEIEV